MLAIGTKVKFNSCNGSPCASCTYDTCAGKVCLDSDGYSRGTIVDFSGNYTIKLKIGHVTIRPENALPENTKADELCLKLATK